MSVQLLLAQLYLTITSFPPQKPEKQAKKNYFLATPHQRALSI